MALGKPEKLSDPGLPYQVELQGVSLVALSFFRDEAAAKQLADLVAEHGGILGACVCCAEIGGHPSDEWTTCEADRGELLDRHAPNSIHSIESPTYAGSFQRSDFGFAKPSHNEIFYYKARLHDDAKPHREGFPAMQRKVGCAPPPLPPPIQPLRSRHVARGGKKIWGNVSHIIGNHLTAICLCRIFTLASERNLDLGMDLYSQMSRTAHQ